MKKASCLILLSLFALPLMVSCASKGKTQVPVVDAEGVKISPSQHLLKEWFPEATEYIHLATCGSSYGPSFMPGKSVTDRTYYVISDHYEATVDFSIKKLGNKDYYELLNVDIDYTKFDPQAVIEARTESE